MASRGLWLPLALRTKSMADGTPAIVKVAVCASAPVIDEVDGCAGSKIRNPKEVVWRYWQEPARGEAFWNTARQNALLLGKWLTLAFVLESLMVAYVPNNLVASIAGDGGFLSILAATLVGIPSYLNGNAALPLVAGLMDKGMAPGPSSLFPTSQRTAASCTPRVRAILRSRQAGSTSTIRARGSA